MCRGGAPPVLVGALSLRRGTAGRRVTLPHMSPPAPARIRSSGPPTLMVSASGPHSLPPQGVSRMGASYRPEGQGSWGGGERVSAAIWVSLLTISLLPLEVTRPGSGALAISSLSRAQCTSLSQEGATAKGLMPRGATSAGALQADGGGGSPPQTSLDLRAACSHGRPGAPFLGLPPWPSAEQVWGAWRPHPAPRLPPAFLWGGEQNPAAAQRTASFSQ